MVKVKKYELLPDLYYHKEHSYVRLQPGGNVRVGLNDFAAKAMKTIVHMELPPVGKALKPGDEFASVEAIKYVGPLNSPVSGTIVALNSLIVERSPAIILEDPYGEGWIIEIKPSNLEDDLKNLMYGEAALDWFRAEIEEKAITRYREGEP